MQLRPDRTGQDDNQIQFSILLLFYVPEVETVQYKSTDSIEYTLLYICTPFACEREVTTTKTGGSFKDMS
jgi:hypothetical protein